MRHACLVATALAAAALAGCNQPNRLTARQLAERVARPDARKLVAQMFESSDPDLRRQAIEELSKHRYGRREPYLKAYALMAGDADNHPMVRRAALRALAKSQDGRYVEALAKSLKDPDKSVRVQAAAALDEMAGPAAVAPLAYAARNDAEPEVRAAAARALRHYRQKDVLDTLLDALDDPDFGVRFKASESLTALTGQSHGTEAAAWRNALAGAKDPFAAAPRRPWWDWFGVTVKKKPAPTAPPTPGSVPKPPTTSTAPTPAAASRSLPTEASTRATPRE